MGLCVFDPAGPYLDFVNIKEHCQVFAGADCF